MSSDALRSAAGFGAPSAPAAAGAPDAADAPRLLNRELSILGFNRRVLAQAERSDVPLLERLRYLTIVSSNLDEFFEVRLADAIEAVEAGKGSAADLDAIADEAHALIDEQYALLNDQLMPALREQGILVLNHAERDEAQRAWVARFFEQQVRPLLVPVGLDPSHPFPLVANKSLNFIARLGGTRCLRAPERHRHRQGAACAAARDPAADRDLRRPPGLRAADQRHPRPPRRAVSGPHGGVVLAVPRHPRLRPRGRRATRSPTCARRCAAG
jgi:hypothetical protein